MTTKSYLLCGIKSSFLQVFLSRPLEAVKSFISSPCDTGKQPLIPKIVSDTGKMTNEWSKVLLLLNMKNCHFWLKIFLPLGTNTFTLKFVLSCRDESFSQKLYLKSEYVHYGNIGFGVSSFGIKILDWFLAKIEQVEKKIYFLSFEMQ